VATQATISRSRSVSWSSCGWGTGAAADGPANWSITRRVTDGDSRDPPAATTRTRAQQLVGSASFSTKPLAPPAQRGEHVVVQLERRQHDDLDVANAASAVTAASVARPSMTGIRMSSSTTSAGSAG
jgi:hypothetical protein